MPRSPKKSIRRISVLGSGKVREKDPTYQQAVKLGQALAREGVTVFHGGFGGVMEAVAKGSRLAGGKNVGVIIRSTPLRPGLCRGKDRVLIRAQRWTDIEVATSSWQSRLFKLIEKGDAYIFLDGATGTLNELFFVWEMANKGLHAKPIILLGKRLHMLVKFLKKDPALKIPSCFYLEPSIARVIKVLKGVERGA